MRRSIDFMLDDWLRVGALLERARFSEHSPATFGSALDMCERMAAAEFAPINRLVDVEEPRIADGKVVLPQATHTALAAYVGSGMLAATQSESAGGMQLPVVIEAAGNAFFYKASIGVVAYPMLTTANANLLMAHGTAAQKAVFGANQLSGRWFGTMCLSEPQAGSSLSDIATRALPDGLEFEADTLGPRYRLTGNKMWISGGEHEITENIVHLVLAKIPDAEGRLVPGTRGISLFIVSKMLVDSTGALTGERNDVALAGLNHKLGFRGTTNCLLNFGERGGAIGYRVGAPGEGLRCMFHMMNEARIRIGLGATMLGWAGYEASLEYARTRRQGRHVGNAGKNASGLGPERPTKDASAPPVPIIEHADVKRMLLAQKAYVEGSLALQLYCARLVDGQTTGSPSERNEAGDLLEVLTPIAKSFPSEWCLEANSLAIQVLGGYGYTRDFPVEQHWRDNRLNMIHEGTHGIQGLDLLGRKVAMRGGAALDAMLARVRATIARAGEMPSLAPASAQLDDAVSRLRSATRSALADGASDAALANATLYLQAFGHVVVAWLWLDMTLALGSRTDMFAAGKRAAMHYFFAYELPKISASLQVVADRNPVCLDTPADAF